MGPNSFTRILLVDDDQSSLDVLARLLRQGGHQVNTAQTAEQALDIAIANPFDLLVTDVGLPGQSGIELMRQIRSLYNVPGIALTGWGAETLSPDDQAIFHTHLIKPIDFNQLLAAIRQIPRP